MSLPNLMEYHGPFGGSIGFHAHALDTLKSALQKYIRRGNKEKAIRCAVDLDMFYKFEPKAKGIRTNMINRLRIISCEEFCWGNPLLFKEMDNQLELWTKNRADNRVEGTRAIISMVDILTKSKPVRMISFIRAAYKHGPLYKEILDNYPELYENINPELLELDNTSLIKEGDPYTMKNLIGQFDYHFKKKSDKCVYWAFKIMNMEDKCARRYRRKGSEYILWEYLLDKLQLENSLKIPIETLFKWYKNNKSEHWMYLINAIMVCLEYEKKSIQSNLEAHYPNIVAVDLSVEEIEKVMDDHKNTLFEIDDYCLDQHTSKGRSKNRGPIHFAKVGSYVEDENKEILNETYKKIYMDLKYITKGQNVGKNIKKKKKKEVVKKNIKIVIKKTKCTKQPTTLKIKLKLKVMISLKKTTIPTISQIKSLPRGQVITTKSKKSVYMDTDFVYKGPYKNTENTYLNNIKYTNALHLLENGLGLPNKLRSSLPILSEVEDNGDIYLQFKNVGKKVDVDYQKLAELRTTKIQTDVLVLPRCSVVNRISEIEQPDNDIKLAVLQHLYFRYLLGIGDSGDHNILLREDGSEQLIAGIDLEDRRSKDQGDSKLSYLFRKAPSKKQVELYSDLTDSIKIFSKDSFTTNLMEKIGMYGIDCAIILNKIEKFV